jgi:hypothetical protein
MYVRKVCGANQTLPQVVDMDDKLSYLNSLPFIVPALLPATFVHFSGDSRPILQQMKYRAANKQSYQKKLKEGLWH